MAATEHPRVRSMPWIADLPAGDRPGAYILATWATFLRLARFVAGSRARDLARTAVAHTAVETGWGSGFYCWNVGNIMAASDAPWFAMTDHAIEGDKMVPFVGRYAFHRTLSAGVAHYYNTIARFGAGRALDLAAAGDPAFLPTLRSTGYFGGFTYVHKGESAPRVDTDAELSSQFAGTLRRVDEELAPIESRARIVRAIVGAVTVGAVGAGIYSLTR